MSIIPDLLQAGANPQADDDDGRSAIIHALHRCDVQCLKMLLELGRNVTSSSTRPSQLDQRAPESSERCTPITVAIEKGSISCLQLLIEYNAKFTWSFPKLSWIAGRSRYFSADRWEMILMMIWKVKGHLNSVLIDSVVQRGDSNLLRRMLDRRIPCVTSNGEPDADYSWMPNAIVGQDNPDMLSVFLKYRDFYGVDIHVCTKGGPSLLQVACGRCSNPEVIDLLLSHGVDPDLVGTRGWSKNLCTPLFRTVQAMAFSANAMQVLVSLLKYNCKLNVESKLDRSSSIYLTALDLALLSCNLHCARALVSAGAKQHHVQQDSNVPVDLVPRAVRCTEKERATFIKEHVETPGSLMILSRQIVNKALGKCTPQKIKELPLPKSIMAFLQYSELTEISNTFKYLMDNGAC
jgi:ankyrin repeat protein